MKTIAVFLICSAVYLGYDLSRGKGGWQNYSALTIQLAAAAEHNRTLRIRNNAIAAEIDDLNKGSAAIIETARRDLGYIKKGEIYYQIAP